MTEYLARPAEPKKKITLCSILFATTKKRTGKSTEANVQRVMICRGERADHDGLIICKSRPLSPANIDAGNFALLWA